jgi:transposase InsO family protein
MYHHNAKLTARGRYELVMLVEDAKLSFRAAAAAMRVSVSTAHAWVVRWRAATPAERASLSCLEDRSSRPARSPRRTEAFTEGRILTARRRTGWGPRLLAGALGVAHSTVWKVLARFGVSRPPTAERERARRYEWPCPGDLLHMDTKRYARFHRPGHAVTGDRGRQGERRPGLGYEYAHAIVDDHSRLAYVELLADERAVTVTAFAQRALSWFADQGIVVRRLMTDNAWAYTHNRSLAQLLDAGGIRHLTTRPYTPRTNGKVERFHQTMSREWGYGMTYPCDDQRREALPYWLSHYNEQRPHSALGGLAPISRVRNLCGQDT